MDARARANEVAYGREITPAEILSGEVPPPEAAAELIQILSRYWPPSCAEGASEGDLRGWRLAAQPEGEGGPARAMLPPPGFSQRPHRLEA